jgi:hypothetical protein
VGFDGWVELLELPEELLHRPRGQVELGDAPGHLGEIADEHHPRHARR